MDGWHLDPGMGGIVDKVEMPVMLNMNVMIFMVVRLAFLFLRMVIGTGASLGWWWSWCYNLERFLSE
jgi:hypothetical protein